MHVTTPANRPSDRRAATLVMACLGVFVACLPITTVSVSLPAIQSALHASTAQLAWVQDAFVLPMAAFILTAGAFGDVHGRKKVFRASATTPTPSGTTAPPAPTTISCASTPGVSRSCAART